MGLVSMVEQTSLEAFERVYPRIGERQLQVLESLTFVEAATDAMIGKAINLPINCITPRRNELVKKECIVALKIDSCPITRGKATFWMITKLGRGVVSFRNQSKI